MDPAAAGGSGVEQVECAASRSGFWLGFLTWVPTWVS